MIRGLLVVIGLLLGLALALAAYGRMAHLRALADPPGWTDAVAPGARLGAGSARIGPGAALDWRLAGFDLRGPVWALALDAPGTALAATGRLRGGGVEIGQPTGTAILTGPRLSGRIVVQGGGGRLAAEGLALDLTGTGDRLTVDGAPHPDGPVRLRIGADGRWVLILPGADGGTARLEGMGPGALLGE